MTVLPRLRAPQQDQAVLAEPPLTEAGRVLAANQQRLAATKVDILGRPLEDLRNQARKEALVAAHQYQQASGQPILPSNHGPLFLAGHQPELFHPGVWVKSFALHGLAQTHRGVALNLIVDHDTAKAMALRMPSIGNGPDARIVTVPFDRWSAEIPHEERGVQEESLFAGFAERAGELTARWDFQPLLPAFWEEVCRQAQRTPLLGERLSAARRTLERRWGCHNLELPVSRLCRTEVFAWYACHLLAELPRFHAIYNECVRDYRRRFGIRSRHHPVPDLVEEGEWREAPLWAWRSGPSRRGRLMARIAGDRIELRVGAEDWSALPRSGKAAVAAWQELERGGYKVRSRALTTTLFARLFIADLFVHGIGGARYDELTDEIIRRFYGLEPPAFLVLSATLLLPFSPFPARPESYRQLARELRDLRYNPQRHLSDGELISPAIAELAARKSAWIGREPIDTHERRERFQVLRALSERLRLYIVDREDDVQRKLARCEQELQANSVLLRRDYAFCLYPEEKLRPFCSSFLNVK